MKGGSNSPKRGSVSPHRKLSKIDSKDKFIDQLINKAKYAKMNKSEKV